MIKKMCYIKDMKIVTISLLIGILGILTGCSSMPAGDPVGYLVGGVGGAGVGRAISDEKWAPAAGAAAGLIGYAAYAELAYPPEQKVFEAYEQGKREARVEASKEFWVNETDGNGYLYEQLVQDGKKPNNRLRQIQEPQFIEGVSYGGIYQYPTGQK